MQIRLFEDRKETQLRFKETEQPDAVLSASQGNNILYFHTLVKSILAIPRSISKICFHRIRKYCCKTPLVFKSLQSPMCYCVKPFSPCKTLSSATEIREIMVHINPA